VASLEQRLKDDIKAAMKAGAREELDVLRMVISDARSAAMASGPERPDIPDDLMLKVLQKAVKTRTESVEAFAKGGRQDLVDHERAQIEIIKRYLPAMASEADVEAVVDAVMAELGVRDKAGMGRVIKETMARLKGAADGAMVSRIVAARLQ